MGRHKKMLSAEEIEARNKRWYGESRNERRRQRYAEDRAFREREKERARAQRRSQDEGVWPNPLENLPRLREIGKMREVILPDRSKARRFVFTTEELAEAIGRKPHILHRWRSAGKWPTGVLKIRANTAYKQVYTLEEVKALIRVLGAHVVRVAYYHHTHTETRDKLFAAVEAVRKKGLGHERTRENAEQTADAA